MDISRQDRVRMERAHVLAWPALRCAEIEGWLWRSSGGGSQRANSVSTTAFIGNDVEGAVAEVEARYQAVGSPARFHTFGETSPPGVVQHLQDRGYRQAEPTITMFKRLGEAAAVPNVEIRENAWDEWRQVYLAAITEDRRIVNATILERIPAPRAFFGGVYEGRVASTALCAVGFGCAVIECVATQREMRRMGLARAVLAAVEHWALGQQADLIGRFRLRNRTYQHCHCITGLASQPVQQIGSGLEKIHNHDGTATDTCSKPFARPRRHFPDVRGRHLI